ncbi:unnamed protein product, partial [Effrenium voratum]
NTFIDVPSGFSPTTTPTDAQPVSTAPAQVHFQQGFLKRPVAPDGNRSRESQSLSNAIDFVTGFKLGADL